MAKISPPPLSLQAIYLRSTSTSMADAFHPNLPGTDLAPLFRTEHQSRIQCNTNTLRTDDGAEKKALWCGFTIGFEFIYVRPKEDGQLPSERELDAHSVARVFAAITAAYTVIGDDFPPPDVLEHWGRHNVLLHTWPYWREFCHGAVLRMGLPVTMIPLMQIEPPPNGSEIPTD
jgi:hypothetical protein